MQRLQELQKIASAYGGMLIWECLPGSPCQRAGIVYGDVLLEVNGVSTSSIADYERAKSLDPEEFRVKFLRRGREHEVIVPLYARRD